MLVDRVGLAMLALGVTGIVWLASPAPEKRAAPEPRTVLSYEQAVRCTTNGGTADAMQGPFDTLGDAAGSGELDVKTMVGVAPFHELTVMRVGDGQPDLGVHDRLVLAVRADGGWYTRDLASIGPTCGGMGSPTWSDAEANAPRIVDGAVSVRVHETFRRGDSEWSSDSLVECRLDP